MASTSVNRKLTTIFAADVAGYSELMATNEESTLDALRSCRKVIDDLIAKHGGRIFNTAGDSVLAEFNSAVEAVRCAISIQEDLRVRNSELPESNQMWLRIGVNVGDVMVENEDLFGDGVNIAARLESLADKGGICISGSTFNLVKNKLSIAFEDIGHQSVKNIPETIPAFKLVPGQVSVGDRTTNTDDTTIFNSRPARRWLVALSAIAAVMLIAGLAVKEGFVQFPFGLSNKYGFDGEWLVTVNSLSGCLSNHDRTYIIRVVDGIINEPQYKIPKIGTISEDGKFEINSLDGTGSVVNKQLGKISGKLGKGSFQGKRPSCRGVVTLTQNN